MAFKQRQDERVEQCQTKHGTESCVEQSLIDSQTNTGIADLYGYGSCNEHTGYGPDDNWSDKRPENIAHFAYRIIYFVAPQVEHL